MPAATLRNATSEDLPFITEGLIAMWVEHAQNEPDLLNEERMRNSDVGSYLAGDFDNPDCIMRVAEVSGAAAGFIRASVGEIEKFFTDHRVLYIDDVFVKDEHRGSGIGRQLVEIVERIARERGIPRIQGRVYAFNTPMQRLLTALGYDAPHATWNKKIAP